MLRAKPAVVRVKLQPGSSVPPVLEVVKYRARIAVENPERQRKRTVVRLRPSHALAVVGNDPDPMSVRTKCSGSNLGE